MYIEAISWNLRSSDWKAGASQMMYAAVAGASAAMVGALFQKAVSSHADRTPQFVAMVREPPPFISKCKQDRCFCPPITSPPSAATEISLWALVPLLGIAMFLGYRLGRSNAQQSVPTRIWPNSPTHSNSGQSGSVSQDTTYELRRFKERTPVSALSIERDKLISLISQETDEASVDEELIQKLTDAFRILWNNRHYRGGWFISVSVIADTLQEMFNGSSESFTETICLILGPSHPEWWIETKEKGKQLRTSYLPAFIVELSKLIQNPGSAVSQTFSSDDESLF